MEVTEGRAFPSVMYQAEATIISLQLGSSESIGTYFDVGFDVHRADPAKDDKTYTIVRLGPEVDQRDIEGVKAILGRELHEVTLAEAVSPDFFQQFVGRRLRLELERPRDERGWYYPVTYVTAIHAMEEVAQEGEQNDPIL